LKDHLVGITDGLAVLAESIRIDNKVNQATGLGLTTAIVCGRCVVTKGEKGTGKLCTSTLAVDIMVRIKEVASRDTVAHSCTISFSIN
jgi:hypothetical protein